MSPSERIVSKDVQFMITCLCDAFYPDVAKAAVEVLEFAGCAVTVPEAQTCCGQPAFNAGDWKATRKVVRHTAKVFDRDRPIILPSGSCAHMVQSGYELAFEKEDDRKEILALTRQTWELCDFLVNGLGIREWPGKLEHKMTVHRSCHTRGSQSYEAALTLLRSIDGVAVMDYEEQEQCCGFGGTFSVAYPNTSVEMGKLKLQHLLEPSPDIVGTLDMACMMHISGLAEHEGIPMNKKHVAEILREAAFQSSAHKAPLPG